MRSLGPSRGRGSRERRLVGFVLSGALLGLFWILLRPSATDEKPGGVDRPRAIDGLGDATPQAPVLTGAEGPSDRPLRPMDRPAPVICVVDELGAALTGAWAALAPPGEIFAGLPSRELGRTDDAGRITVPPEVCGPASAGHVLVCVLPGYVSGTMAFEEVLRHGATRINEPFRIVLQRGLAIEGRVRDPWGRPIAGALVELAGPLGGVLRWRTLLGPEIGPAGANQVVHARSAEDGRFELRGIRSLPMFLRAEHAHYVHLALLRGEVPDDRPLDIVLQPLLRADVRVLDAETGAMLRSAMVLLEEQPSGLDFPTMEAGSHGMEAAITCRLCASANARSDPHGSPEVKLLVTAPAHESQRVMATLAPQTAAGSRSPIEVRLRPLVPPSARGSLRVEIAPVIPLRRPLARTILRVRPLGAPTRDPPPPYWLWLEGQAGRVDLPAGRYEVALDGSDGWPLHLSPGPPQIVEIRAGAETVYRSSLEFGLLRVRVEPSDGVRLPMFGAALLRRRTVRWTQVGFLDVHQLKTAESLQPLRDSFEIHDDLVEIPVEPGEYRLFWRWGALDLEAPAFRVASGQAADVVLRPPPLK